MENKIYNYKGHQISFFKEDDVMVNATEMIKAFPNKRMNDFLSNTQTYQFIQVLSETGIPASQIIRVNKGNSSNFKQGTLMHRKLALKLAAWLSPEFELWVYDRIDEITRYGLTATPETLEKILNNPDLLISLASQLKNEREKNKELHKKNILQEAQLGIQAPKVEYYNNVLQSKSTYTTNQIAKELGMSAITLNRILAKMRIQYKQNGTWLLYSKYQNKGYTKTKTHSFVDAFNLEQTSMQTVWTEKGCKFIHDRLEYKKQTA